MSLTQPRTADELLNYRLNRLLAASGAMVVRLCEGRYGITRREWRVVALLAENGAMTPSELAQRAHLERARVSRLIGELVGKKLIERVWLGGSVRRAEVRLTPAGEALYADLLPQSVRFNQEVLAVLSLEELAIFERALDKITQAAEQLAATRPVAEKADRRHGGARRVRGR